MMSLFSWGMQRQATRDKIFYLTQLSFTRHIGTVQLRNSEKRKIIANEAADPRGSAVELANHTPYSKMAAILVFFCLIVN